MEKQQYTIIIETPKGAHIKRNEYGKIDLISPFPSPFDYGRVEGLYGRDGDPLDAIVLGVETVYNQEYHLPLIGVVRFLDGGQEDHKLIFSHRSAKPEEEKKIKKFFVRYAQIKNLTRLLQFRHCPSRFLGIKWGTIDIHEFTRR